MNTVLFVNATIGFSENLSLVNNSFDGVPKFKNKENFIHNSSKNCSGLVVKNLQRCKRYANLVN